LFYGIKTNRVSMMLARWVEAYLDWVVDNILCPRGRSIISLHYYDTIIAQSEHGIMENRASTVDHLLSFFLATLVTQQRVD